jgi:hypothetical protein
MAKIEQLTPEEEALISIVRDEWLRIGLATGPADREVAQAAISDAYRRAGLAPPHRWIWMASPWASHLGISMLLYSRLIRDISSQIWEQVSPILDQTGNEELNWLWKQIEEPFSRRGDIIKTQVDQGIYERVWSELDRSPNESVADQLQEHVENRLSSQIRTHVGDQIWRTVFAPGWGPIQDQFLSINNGHFHGQYLTVADFFHRTKRVKGIEFVEPFIRAAQVAGEWWPFDGACMVTECPIALHHDDFYRLHCDSGPALIYPDGWSIHSWHGTSIPAWMIEEKHRITPRSIDAEDNAELRRIMLEISARSPSPDQST